MTDEDKRNKLREQRQKDSRLVESRILLDNKSSDDFKLIESISNEIFSNKDMIESYKNLSDVMQMTVCVYLCRSIKTNLNNLGEWVSVTEFDTELAKCNSMINFFLSLDDVYKVQIAISCELELSTIIHHYIDELSLFKDLDEKISKLYNEMLYQMQ